MLEDIMSAIGKVASGGDIAGDAAGDAAPEKKTLFACKGHVASALINGEVDIEVTEDDFALTSLLDATRIRWADVIKLDFVDYTVGIKTRTGLYVLSRLGYDGEPCYNHMLAAYGAKIRKAFFVKGKVVATANGDVWVRRGVPIEVYENCIVSLPPDLFARRVPLSFVNGFEDKDYSLTVSTIDGISTTYAKLGNDYAPVVKAAQDGIKALRKKVLDQITDLDPSLSGEQASALAKLMPEGMAAPVGAIRQIAPSFVAALEAKLAGTRAADEYKILQEISGTDAICIGFRSAIDAPTTAASHLSLRGAEGDEAIQDEASSDEKDNYMLWLIAPNQAGDACAVEFAGAEADAAATYVYRFDGGFDTFRIQLSMALEAIDFKRDAIRFSVEDLAKPENEIYRLANDRVDALKLVRAGFAGRAIHRTMDSWKKQLEELLS